MSCLLIPDICYNLRDKRVGVPAVDLLVQILLPEHVGGLDVLLVLRDAGENDKKFWNRINMKFIKNLDKRDKRNEKRNRIEEATLDAEL